ncbi:MAG: hypothetical protein D5S00_08680 [Tindallia sp. MSAO_Bac2]|nr:MAG: hypothetical protein D5S00_08680 [Tindallia sp. MSAO_Bac2]
MKRHVVQGMIYAVDHMNLEYAVCSIEQITYEDESFVYTFKPHYNIIKLCDPSFFQGIPGLNLDLQKEMYTRENKTPTFIYERTPQENREDLWDLLDEVGMEYLDKLEWLIRTDKVYTGDRLIVKRHKAPAAKNNLDEIVFGDVIRIRTIDDFCKTYFEKLKVLLTIITTGANLEADDMTINAENREAIFRIVHHLFKSEYLKRKDKQKKGIEEARKNKVYKGRKKIKVSKPKLEEVMGKMNKGEITAKEAAALLGLGSVSTLYRRIKEFREGEN